LAGLKARFGTFYLLPEGGSNVIAVRGCEEIVSELRGQLVDGFDAVCCACGSGATLAGLVAGLAPRQTALGISVLKGGGFLKQDVAGLMVLAGHGERRGWDILLDYHHGGYARMTPQLVQFMDDFERRHGVPLDPVYTGKLLFAVYQLIGSGYFTRGSRVVVLHSGGLQGRRGMAVKMQALRRQPVLSTGFYACSNTTDERALIPHNLWKL
jgi:1-aminocyclopropane-1-carboxylate deaminase